MTFACGGCLVKAHQSTILENITGFIQEARITYAQLTPSIIQLLDPANIPRLEIFASSGEALPRSLADKWRAQVRLVNAYGPTETIVCSIQHLSVNGVDSACIGQALDGLDICLLADGSVDVVPEGEIGEICFAGPQLYRGYCSVEPHVQARECIGNGKRYYRTGDRGRLENYPIGTKSIRYLGRSDAQVKVHGIRVELGDIEQSIMACDRVHHCAVILPQEGRFAGRLCVIVIPRKSSHAPESFEKQSADSTTKHHAKPAQMLLPPSAGVLEFLQEVKDTVSQALQKSVVPTNWWPLKELPLISSGKVDRIGLRNWLEQKLTQPYVDRSDGTINRFGATTDSTKDEYTWLLQSLWAEILGRPIAVISPTTSFVELGPDSLDVIQFVSKARKAGYNVTFPQVYAAKSICQLARHQEGIQDSVGRGNRDYLPFSILPRHRPLARLLENIAKACNIGVGEIEDVYPCTPYQAGLMLLDLKHPNTYVCSFSWSLQFHIEIDRFHSAWRKLVAREPVLRNRLMWDTVAQVFWQATIRNEGPAYLSREHFERPMKLGHDLCRGYTQWDTGTQRWKFHLRIHHRIIDGWSLRLMLNRLKSLYFGEDVDQPEALPFPYFIRYRLEQQESEETACRSFWR